ncbi:MAG: molybdopterin molybdotransferase MoeA [Amaricoccus sp.]|uniref:molybdopterin molybdotransferase MoeA n=1 Tax=Amaricoccus sp. TaxID=1872485 RepID=UPI0039E3E6A8
MLPVGEAHARLMALFSPVESETIPLAEAGARVLAVDVVAARAQPPVAISAMDGYAVRAADLAPGVRLRLVGTAAAGRGLDGRIGAGEAARIFTGAPVPPGADTVLIQEDADTGEGWVAPKPGHDTDSNIRPAGGDFPAGARIVAPRRLSPADLALVAAMGADPVRVYRRPVVALLMTGDELVMPGEVPGPDQVVASNAFGLKAMLEAAGAEVRILPIARDTAESLDLGFSLAAGADLLVTIGGASVGDRDLVRPTAVARGLDLEFHRIAIRPGKPLMAGRLGGAAFVGLPGNPVSALVTGRVFLVPAVERMLGLAGDPPARLRARLGAPVAANGPRTHFMRARVEAGPDGWRCTAFDRQDSSLLSILSDANALLVRPESDPSQQLGAEVEFIWI